MRRPRRSGRWRDRRADRPAPDADRACRPTGSATGCLRLPVRAWRTSQSAWRLGATGTVNDPRRARTNRSPRRIARAAPAGRSRRRARRVPRAASPQDRRPRHQPRSARRHRCGCPGGASETDAAVVAFEVSDAAFSGFRIVGDAATPLGTGVVIRNSNVALSDIEVTGAHIAGDRIRRHRRRIGCRRRPSRQSWRGDRRPRRARRRASPTTRSPATRRRSVPPERCSSKPAARPVLDQQHLPWHQRRTRSSCRRDRPRDAFDARQLVRQSAGRARPAPLGAAPAGEAGDDDRLSAGRSVRDRRARSAAAGWRRCSWPTTRGTRGRSR